jgi:hypothetical protein
VTDGGKFSSSSNIEFRYNCDTFCCFIERKLVINNYRIVWQLFYIATG